MPRVTLTGGSGHGIDLMEVDGLCLPLFNAIKTDEDAITHLQNIKQLAARPDDVIVMGFPKSGTHWVWEIINMLLKQKAVYEVSTKESSFFELVKTDTLSQLTSPRVLNTHLLYDNLPEEMVKQKTKIIYLTRNPKDVMVSVYNHICASKTFDYKGTWADFIPLFMGDKFMYESWFAYVKNWERTICDNPDHPIHTIAYENLQQNQVEEIEKLATFLGVKCDKTLLDNIIDKCSFQKLSNADRECDILKAKSTGHNFIYRKGKVGDWKNWFTVAQNEEFDAEHVKRMKGSHLTFKFTV